MADQRDPHAAERRAAREQAYRDAMGYARTAQAIADCGLCDDDGYRGPQVCDHIDRTDTYRRGMALIRSVLAEKHPQ